MSNAENKLEAIVRGLVPTSAPLMQQLTVLSHVRELVGEIVDAVRVGRCDDTRKNLLKLPFFKSRARSIERAQRAAQQRESDAIRARILYRVRSIELAEQNRPEKSRALEGALVEVWL